MNKLHLNHSQLIDLYFLKYGLTCPACKIRVFDPDKSNKHQVYITDTCPSCGVDPAEHKKQLKQARKKNRREQIKANNHSKR